MKIEELEILDFFNTENKSLLDQAARSIFDLGFVPDIFKTNPFFLANYTAEQKRFFFSKIEKHISDIFESESIVLSTIHLEISLDFDFTDKKSPYTKPIQYRAFFNAEASGACSLNYLKNQGGHEHWLFKYKTEHSDEHKEEHYITLANCLDELRFVNLKNKQKQIMLDRMGEYARF